LFVSLEILCRSTPVEGFTTLIAFKKSIGGNLDYELYLSFNDSAPLHVIVTGYFNSNTYGCADSTTNVGFRIYIKVFSFELTSAKNSQRTSMKVMIEFEIGDITAESASMVQNELT
jgi:hypothetical protein